MIFYLKLATNVLPLPSITASKCDVIVNFRLFVVGFIDMVWTKGLTKIKRYNMTEAFSFRILYESAGMKFATKHVYKSFRHTLNMLLYYLVKYKCSKMTQIMRRINSIRYWLCHRICSIYPPSNCIWWYKLTDACSLVNCRKSSIFFHKNSAFPLEARDNV